MGIVLGVYVLESVGDLTVLYIFLTNTFFLIKLEELKGKKQSPQTELVYPSMLFHE